MGNTALEEASYNGYVEINKILYQHSDEYNSLRCQFGTLKKGEHAKYLPFVFTEQGVAMLSSVLNSRKAILVNIAIMRAFVQMRAMLETNAKFAAKLKELENRLDMNDQNVVAIMHALRDHLKQTQPPPKKKIGFHTD